MAHDLAEELRPTGVGIGQWAVLLFLWARDGQTQAELPGWWRSSLRRWSAPSTEWPGMGS
jgi:hypothetical protein